MGDEHTEDMNAYYHIGSLYIFTSLHYLMHCSLAHYIYMYIHDTQMCNKDLWPTSVMTSTYYCQLNTDSCTYGIK